MVQRKKRGSGSNRNRGAYGYTLDFKLRIIREIRAGTSVVEVARIFGVGPKTVYNWVHEFKNIGIDGLLNEAPGRKKRPRDPEDVRFEAITDLRDEHPEYGTRRIRDVLARFEGLGVSETLVRQILHEAGMLDTAPTVAAKEQPPPTRFERAEPNQLWQSDIFTFLLRKHQRLYLVAFLDDHSRFVVGHALGHHQKSSLVLEGLSRAIADFGAPRELLTDQGRQYTAWRGETEFEQELRRHCHQRCPRVPISSRTAGPGSGDELNSGAWPAAV